MFSRADHAVERGAFWVGGLVSILDVGPDC